MQQTVTPADAGRERISDWTAFRRALIVIGTIALALPPALTLFAVLAFGALFGAMGVLVATPLAVVAYVAVTDLYVRDALGEDVAVPGSAAAQSAPAS